MGQQEQTRTDMLPEDIMNMKVLTGLIGRANALLSLNEKQIWEKFSRYPICFMDFYEKDERQKSVEIRFDTEKTSITCLFDRNGICDYAFVTPDYIDPIGYYVDFFNSIYKYDPIRCRWIMAHGYLSQMKTSLGVLFMVNS